MRAAGWVGLGLAVLAVPQSGMGAGSEAEKTGVPMLVRSWDEHTLIGWLPLHCASIRLRLIDKQAPHFELDQAATIYFLRAPGELKISPEPRVIEGLTYLPVQRDANVVRVMKRLFLVEQIVLGDESYHLPRQGKGR